jgi:hypothetical protein
MGRIGALPISERNFGVSLLEDRLNTEQRVMASQAVDTDGFSVGVHIKLATTLGEVLMLDCALSMITAPGRHGAT